MTGAFIIGYPLKTVYRCNWWTITARGGNSTNACNVNSTGNVNNNNASNSYRVPI